MVLRSARTQLRRLVKDALATEIANMHGLTVKTFTPSKWEAKAGAGGR